MTTLDLPSGHRIPQVGFGLWKVPREKTAQVVYDAILFGYRHFDGAYDYQNEIEAGEGIQKAIKDGIVKREDIFITTKLWNNYHSYEDALNMGKKQNAKWGLEYIDLYLIHFPTALKFIDPKHLEYPAWWTDAKRTTVETARVPIRETWEALETLVDDGIVKSIGVSNFSAQTIYDIQTYNKHPISSLQIEHHPYLVQHELIKLAQENKIIVTAYSSYGPQSFLELPNQFSELAKGITTLFENEDIVEISKAHKKSQSEVLLRWATQRGIVVIPKSSSENHLKQNLNHVDYDLSKEEIEKISKLDRKLRFNDPGYYLPNHPLRIFA